MRPNFRPVQITFAVLALVLAGVAIIEIYTGAKDDFLVPSLIAAGGHAILCAWCCFRVWDIQDNYIQRKTKRPERWVEWVEPFGPSNEPVYCRVTESTAIATQRNAAKDIKPYESDERALEDFMTVHWATFVKI